jgi:DNA-binding NarL/FixJ family response regulator
MPSLLIVGEIGLYREGLAFALNQYDEFQEVLTASDVSAALRWVQEMPPEVILVDLAMSNPLATLRALAQNAEGSVLIALTVPEASADIIACAEAGADAYVTRTGSMDDLMKTILAAKQGELRCSAKVAGALFRHLSSVETRTHTADQLLTLSPRERQVLHLIEDGRSNKEISRALGIEVATVKNHVHHLLEKLNVRRRGEAAALLRQAP